MKTSDSIVNISKALLDAQRKMGAVSKDAKNPFFKSSYASLNNVREAVMPALNESGITLLQPTTSKEGKVYVETILLHESGEFISGDTEAVLAKVNDPQSLGSAISYARRYGLMSTLGLAAEDDDGNSASGKTSVAASESAKTSEASSSKPASFNKKALAKASGEGDLI